MEKVSNLLRSRGLATVRLIDELGSINEDMIASANLWVRKGFSEEVSGIYSMIDYVRSSIELKRSRSRRK
ncbi:hypothetical protein [Vulcanisaeta sp. JCM 16161]|uniref:hypothetical protein n=1 Tax=Vulcanisaeta sp. JCM 16161 TaxID=1295372 RepID=UPI000ACEA41D|nr:hypothetical protein [Vulcanisaeta sp. JCM 16161]